MTSLSIIASIKNQHVLTLLLELIEPTTWKAFQGVVISLRKPAEVADELVISPNAVFLNKSIILNGLREEIDGLLN